MICDDSKWTMNFADFPVFILGNGPGLPVDALGSLSNQFTVGVNRILGSRFTPTVLMWVDQPVYKDVDNGPLMDHTEALLLCDRSIVKKPNHHGLKPLIGNMAKKTAFPKPWEFAVNGNTGCGAARWALSLGCPKAYLLGMGAMYNGEDTDFYGVNPLHKKRTLHTMRGELARLKADFGDRVVPIDSLNTILEGLALLDQAELRSGVLEAIQEPS